MPFWESIGPVAKLVDTVFSWFTSEQGFAEVKKKREGRRLEEAADAAFKQWIEVPSADNWKRYEEARDALKRHSTTP